ncbi:MULTISPECIES: sel1 repeat family protein [Pseudomonas]|uniref:sel1 repeat family protein n=1 Tax=Pseudomonas TaxID=286 RepID=UPI0018E720B8|nr:MULTISPECIES: sel1 repeat family protein [Pseudomonas]MBJ2215990.1 sel1 repeat family protein [Pseudomonas carnis]MBP5948011.1 sel1 repeat family protein [Pseudomonas sp. P9(2020)]
MDTRLLLFASLLLTCFAVNAGTNALPDTEHLKPGLQAMRQGDKTKAWDLLFPQAQQGDVQAMFYLGEMMMRSPEYPDALERAMQFFTAAAARGHEGAKKLIPQVKRVIEQRTTGGVATIAGFSGTPSETEIAQAKARFEKYKQEVLRFTDTGSGMPRLEVLVFLDKADTATERMYRMSQSLEQQFGTKIHVKFFVVINPAVWKPDQTPIGSTKVPPIGFTPDFKGQLAAQHGVYKTPAVVLIPPNGKSRVVTDLDSLTNTLSSLL